MGNGEAKELTCTTHGHELRGVECWWEKWWRAEENKGGKWDNCNNIINKIYFKKKKTKEKECHKMQQREWAMVSEATEVKKIIYIPICILCKILI